MIFLAIGVAILVLLAVAASISAIRVAAHVESAADEVTATVSQLVDALAEVHLDHAERAQQLADLIASLDRHQGAMNDMADQLVAQRKLVKAHIRESARVTSQADRILAKQYAQQRDVDDILYWVRQARERGELNG